ncbi:MAG: nuclear transport factor 2 family protein [Sphingobacteriales bacterium]
MENLTNLTIIQQLYKNFAAGNIPAVLAAFDKDIVWIRPGEPDIPFSGKFTGLDGLGKMFALQSASIKIKSFVPEKFCTNENTVVVIGHDTVEVIPTCKTYNTDWVQAFTLKDGLITNVMVYIDTNAIAKAFLQ